MTQLAECDDEIVDIVKFDSGNYYLFSRNKFYVYDGSTPYLSGTGISINASYKRHPIVVGDDVIFFIN